MGKPDPCPALPCPLLVGVLSPSWGSLTGRKASNKAQDLWGVRTVTGRGDRERPLSLVISDFNPACNQEKWFEIPGDTCHRSTARQVPPNPENRKGSWGSTPHSGQGQAWVCREPPHSCPGSKTSVWKEASTVDCTRTIKTLACSSLLHPGPSRQA